MRRGSLLARRSIGLPCGDSSADLATWRLVGSYRQPLSDLPTDDDVPDYRYFLTGFRNRLTVAMSWSWNYLTFGDSIDHGNFRLTDRKRNAGCDSGGPRRSVPWSIVRRCCATNSPSRAGSMCDVGTSWKVSFQRVS